MTGYKLIFLFFLITSSLFAESVIDSLDIANKETIIDTTSAPPDTIRTYSKDIIIKEIASKQTPFKKDINSICGISEGFYLYFPNLYKQHYELNGFILNHNNFSKSLYRLLYQPFYNISNSFSITDFNQVRYSLPVPVANSYAGIGSSDANYAYLSFYKGALINRFNINFAYLGDENNWNLTNSKSKNFHLFVEYKPSFASISYTNDSFDRKIPNFFITSQADSFKTIPLKLNSQEIHIDSKITDIALKSSKVSYDDTISYTYQAFVRKRINHAFGYIEPKYEITKTDSLESFISLKTLFRYSNIALKSYFNYHYKKEFYLFLYGKYDITPHYSFITKYISDNFYDEYKKIYLGGKITDFGLEILFGKTSEENFETFFVDVTHDNTFEFNQLSLDIKNRFIFNRKTNEQNPYLEFANTSELIYRLNYDNSIRIGVEYNLLSFDDKMHIYDLFLNGYIGIGITKYFSLQINFINLTNEYSYYKISEDPYHVNVGFNWVFFN